MVYNGAEWAIVEKGGPRWLRRPTDGRRCGTGKVDGDSIPSLYGEYSFNLDDKGRIVVPSRFRQAFAQGYYLTHGPEASLYLLPLATWAGARARLEQMSRSTPELWMLRRLLHSGTYGTPDSQGRLLVPPGLREYASLVAGGPVTLIGVENRMELWNTSRWQALARRSVPPPSPMAEKFAELGL